MKFLRQQHKSSDEFENGCCSVNCGTAQVS